MKRGVVCYISNHSFLEDPSYVVMRQHLLGGFDKVWIDEMNGDSRWTGKKTPDGRPDPSVFSTPFNKEGIRVGTAITLWVRKGASSGVPEVQFRQFWGERKRADVLASLKDEPFGADYRQVVPKESNWYTLRPWAVEHNWDEWPRVPELSAIPPMLGLNENRNGALSDIDVGALIDRMRAYYDPHVTADEVKMRHEGLLTRMAGFEKPEQTRAALGKNSAFVEANIRRFWFKPFDLRWAYVERLGGLWNRVRPELLALEAAGSEFLLIRRRAPGARDGAAFFYSRHLSDQHTLHKDAYFVPLRLGPRRGQKKVAEQADFLTLAASTPRSNLSDLARSYLMSIGITAADQDDEAAELMWMHVLACGYAPCYVAENPAGLQTDWPRIPLPGTQHLLRTSSQLGRTVADLLDVDRVVPGVSGGALREELKLIGRLKRADGTSGQVDLGVRAGWGHLAQRGIVMPGNQTPSIRDYTAEEIVKLDRGAAALNISLSDMLRCLGSRTYDVPLNETTIWSNVPERVWEYSIGGQQVFKKWLSYRARAVLGRDLTTDEVLEALHMARRLAALLLLEPSLDSSYAATKANFWRLPSSVDL